MVIARTGPASLLWLLAGFTVWSAAFLGLYIIHAVGCEWGWHAREVGGLGLLRAVLVATWIAHLGLAAAVTLAARRLRAVGETPPAVRAAAFGLGVAAIVSTLWTGLPVLALPLCA